MMRERVVGEAMSWLGTPYMHHQSCKGHGADCVGFVYGVYKAVGLIPADWKPPAYSRQWHLHQNEELLVEGVLRLGGWELAIDQALPGDVVTFQYGKVASHVAIALPDQRVIHAHMDVGRVTVTLFVGSFKARARKAFRLPGLD